MERVYVIDTVVLMLGVTSPGYMRDCHEYGVGQVEAPWGDCGMPLPRGPGIAGGSKIEAVLENIL